MTTAEQPSADWLGDSELRLPSGIVLSFQRYELPASGVIARAPPSLGALPVGLSREGALLLPLASRECFWIGLSSEAARPVSLAVAIERDDGSVIDVLSGTAWNVRAPARVHVPPCSVIDGVRRADGAFDPLLRDDGLGSHPGGRRLHMLFHDEPASIQPALLELVDYTAFSQRTGAAAPQPLDPDAGYKGWRLP